MWWNPRSRLYHCEQQSPRRGGIVIKEHVGCSSSSWWLSHWSHRDSKFWATPALSAHPKMLTNLICCHKPSCFTSPLQDWSVATASSCDFPTGMKTHSTDGLPLITSFSLKWRLVFRPSSVRFSSDSRKQLQGYGGTLPVVLSHVCCVWRCEFIMLVCTHVFKLFKNYSWLLWFMDELAWI